MIMDNLEVTGKSICFEKHKERFGNKITYKTSIRIVKGNICVYRERYVNDQSVSCDLVHIPIELIDQIKKLKQDE